MFVKNCLLIFSIIFFLSMFKVNAQIRGCLIGDKVYFQGRISNKFFKGSGFYQDESNCITGGQYYMLVKETERDCYAIYDNSGPDTNPSNYLLGPGDRVTFTLYNCPIDDYIPLLILATGG